MRRGARGASRKDREGEREKDEEGKAIFWMPSTRAARPRERATRGRSAAHDENTRQARRLRTVRTDWNGRGKGRDGDEGRGEV